MSVTNPDRVVTKQDLADFYEQIKPYMGTFPATLANKLSKGDIYSADERIIGQWIDGKPLYQKTINFGALVDSDYKDVNTGLTNINLIDAYGASKSTSGPMISIPFARVGGNSVDITLRDNGATLRLYCQGTLLYAGYTTTYVTLKYIKTTDSATSMGDETDYSTTEKIIGTWIDGKPLYQKTINFGTLPSSATTKSVNHNISNIGTVVKIFGNASGAGFVGVPLPFAATNSSGDVGTGITLLATTTQVQLSTGMDRSSLSAYITIQYTKTTD